MKSILPILSLALLLVHQVLSWCEHSRIQDVDAVTSVDYSPDGTMMLTTTQSRVTIWERVTKQVLFVKPITGGKYAKFSPDSPSTYIAISTASSSIEIISAVSPFGSIQTFNANHGGTPAAYIDWTAANQLITCGGTNNKLKTWNVAANPATTILDAGVPQILTCSYLSATQIGTAANNNKLDLQTVAAPSTINSVFSKAFTSCQEIAFSPNSLYMIAACNGGGANGVFITISGAAVVNVVTTGLMRTVAYAGDGDTFCYGGDSMILYIVNGTSANKTIMSQFLENSAILDTDFMNNGLYLVVGTQDGTVYEYAKYCLSCRPGYYTNLTTKTCIQCQSTLQGCAFCPNSTYCSQCYENFIIDTSTHRCTSCATLWQGCGTCFNATMCRYCVPGYYLLADWSCGRCQAVLRGCYSCNSSSVCFQCQSDFYLDATNYTCVGCETVLLNCIKCTNSSYCTTCKIGYYRSSGVCTACPTNCYACQTATNCTDCVTGYYAFSSGGTVTCTKCPAGCLACNATGHCKDCADDRYLDSAGACTQCSYPCVTCNTSFYCLSCEMAYFYNGVGGCTECSGGCISCNSSASCLSCSPGYYLDIPTHTCLLCELTISMCMQCTNTSCLKCQIGFYLFNSTTCSSCIDTMPACITCTSSTVCQFCAAGYYKTSNPGPLSCQICPLGCATCRSSTNCTSCNIGYYLDSTAATCNPCANNCVGCSSASYCLECQIGYRLGAGGTCVACVTDIGGCQSCVYNYTAAGIWCLSCQLGRYLSSTGGCSSCPQNCTACLNSTYCLTCEIGMYPNATHLCEACQHNCSECVGSATNCSSCIAGYYLTTGFACLHCSAFGCATCNSTTHDCLSCQLGFYLKTVTGPPTKICQNCLTTLPNCYICTSPTACKQCSYGYALAPSLSSCTPCSALQGCKHCTTLSSCQNCQVGYYLVVNGTGFGSCVKCSTGCKDCDGAGLCLSCFAEYLWGNVSGVVSCGLCELVLGGCLTCSSSAVCTVCLSGYYLSNNTCHLCSEPIFACRYCNFSTVCTACLDGYYLAASNLCTKCESSIVGCQLCNSSSVCLACEYGMYLNSNLCYKCTTSLPNCIYCLNLATCLQCDAGSYLSAGGCLDCQAHITGCIQCNSNTECLQCKGGYFLNSSTHLCQACQQQGCQICLESNPLDCVKCNSRFYFNSSLNTCIKCRTDIDGCLQCSNSTRCNKCDPGYYVNAAYSCQLCESVLYGCGRCSSASACLECKSTYYLYSGNNSCVECKATLEGCSHCINGTACQSCYHGYYMNASSLCVTCTELAGCLSCLNGSYCQYCQNSYFLQATENKCYPCSTLQGCYACTTNRTCSICGGGYILNDQQLCQVMRVQAHETIKDLKLVTKFLNATHLIHYLYAKDMTYNQSNGINWTKTTKLILEDSSYKQTKLTILNVQWGTNGYTLIFYTDNPLQLGQNNFQFARRRMLLTGALASKYKVNLQMDQKTINEILPAFYLPKDLVMGYDISSPQFVMSYANANPSLLFYSIFGYVITSLFIIKYLLKSTCSAPSSPQMGQLIPQILSLKAPAFLIYPTFLQFVYYCSGFTIPELPWTNELFGRLLADHSDTVVQSYALFYANMHIGSTYMLALIVVFVVGFVLWLVFYGRSQEERRDGFALGVVVYNVFVFGAVWAGCASLQGALLNPIQTITLNSGFYMIGIAFYCLIFAFTLYSLYKSRTNLYRLRIFIKSSLLSLANMSPIYIFSTCILIDIVLVLLQHYFSTLKRLYPKLWILKNVLCELALCVLVFMPSIMLSLIIASFFVTVVFLIDVYTHGREYKERDGKRKFRPDQEDTVDVNIWNINFEKSNQKYAVEDIQDDEESKSKEVSDARRTAFQKTHDTFGSKDKSYSSPFKRRQKRKAIQDEEQPDIMNPQDPRQVEKRKKNDEDDDGNVFVAQKYLS